MPATLLAMAAAFGPLLGGATYGLRGAPPSERATNLVMMLAAWGGSYAPSVFEGRSGPSGSEPPPSGR
ncbi:hypothetical protein OHB00_16985 [Streptomyces sp. NBC_00631]|uniref:hypothetical protein n=1 Tax=Streptomyces sp. NBC_00631 TaxID=2975793 RepID=UPI0030E465C0